MRLAVALPLGLLALATTASAQLGRPNGFKVDVTAAAGAAFNGMLGVQAVPGSGGTTRYLVSGRRDLAANPHRLFEFDGSGALVTSYSQPAATSTSAWGIRDMAYDGTRVWGGLEGSTLHGFNPATNTYDATLTVGAGPTLIRALAYDPTTNHFWTGNFNASIYEFDATTGAIVGAPLPNPAGGPYGAVYGAAYDPARGTIWWFSQNGLPAPATAGCVWTEMDPITRTPTGQRHVGDLTVPGTPAGGIAGGADFHIKNGVPTLLALTQATSDTIYEQHGRYDQIGCPLGAVLETDGQAPCSPNPTFELDVTNIPANIAMTQMAIGFPGGFPPLPPLLPCGWPMDLGSTLFLATVPPAAGAATHPAPIPAGIPIHAEIEITIMLIDFGPPLSIYVIKLTIVFSS